MSYLPAMRCCGADPCSFIIQLMVQGWITLFLSRSVKRGQYHCIVFLQIFWIPVIHWNMALFIIGTTPIAAWIISWAPMHCYLSCGLSLILKVSPNLSSYVPMKAQSSNFHSKRKLGVTSVTKNHNWVCTWNSICAHWRLYIHKMIKHRQPPKGWSEVLCRLLQDM